MDAKERLRRYLEQRRELGEQELVLDAMGVDEVLRIVGALRGAPATGAGGPAAAVPPVPAAGTGPTVPSAPASSAPQERPAPPAVPARPDAPDAPDAPVPTDWRAALRAAGGAPDQVNRARSQPSPPASSAPAAVTPPPVSATGSGAGGPSGTPGAGEAEDHDPEAQMARRKAAQADPGGPRGEGGTVPPERTATGPVAERERKAGAVGAKARSGGPAWLAELDVPVGLEVGTGATELFEGSIARLRTLDELAATVEKCTRCPLYATATRGVPGEGHPDADFFCVGEAPGANEDQEGRPFIGAAGQLLTKILAAIKLTREEVFIANVLKHRPPGNRNPAPNEVEACSPYLLRQLELVKPKVIVAFGTFAAQTLLETKTPIGKLRGHVHLYHGIPLVVTYHPAALLRNPAWKRPTWEDVQLARRILDRATGA